MTLPPRIPVTRDQIGAVVRDFYARVRQDPDLGPIFAGHINDWPSHEDKILRFWANALLYERDYDGNPMQVHMDSGDVAPSHFAIWLPLFDEVLFDQLPETTAQSWSALAHRIGKGLRYGLEASLRSPTDVPHLG
jgi:hemoglobin